MFLQKIQSPSIQNPFHPPITAGQPNPPNIPPQK